MRKFQIVVVIQDKIFKVISDGTPEGTVFEGDEEDTSYARGVANLKLSVPMGEQRNRPVVQAGFDTPLGLTAALFAIAPQYAYVHRAPQEVLDVLTANKGCISFGDDREASN